MDWLKKIISTFPLNLILPCIIVMQWVVNYHLWKACTEPPQIKTGVGTAICSWKPNYSKEFLFHLLLKGINTGNSGLVNQALWRIDIFEYDLNEVLPQLGELSLHHRNEAVRKLAEETIGKINRKNSVHSE